MACLSSESARANSVSGVVFEVCMLAAAFVWLLGAPVGTAARVGCLIVLGLILLGVRPNALRLSYWPFCILWLLGVLSQEFALYWSAGQGLDFAIFSQVIQSVSQRGGLYTSFIWDGWINFLSHHISPILYVPGLLGFLGVGGPQAAILFHVLCVGAGLWFFFRCAESLKFDRRTAGLLVFLLTLNPTFRVGVSWEVRDEIFALPWIGLAYDSYFRGKYRLSFLAVVGACLCKENFYLFAVLFSISVALDAWVRERLTGNVRSLSLCCGVLGLCCLAFYFLLYPQIIQLTFDPRARIANWGELLDPESIRQKAKFLLIVFLPILFSPLLSRRGVIAAIPALAFLLPIAVTNFSNMYHPYNYYGVVPTYILGIASLHTLRGHNQSVPTVPVWGALLAALLSLSMATFSRPGWEIYSRSKLGRFKAEDLRAIPADARIVADDYSLPFLLDKTHVARVWTAEQHPIPWEYVVVRKNGEVDLPSAFIADSRVCSDLPRWTIRCRR